MTDLPESWVPLGCNKLFLFTVVFWCCGNPEIKCREKGVFVRSPTEIMFRILSSLQRWRVLLKAAEQKTLDEQMLQVKEWMKSSVSQVRLRDSSFSVASKMKASVTGSILFL
jgi:hypothetical protein